MGVLGGVFVMKSGLRILIWAPEVPFSAPPKTPIWSFWGVPTHNLAMLWTVTGVSDNFFNFLNRTNEIGEEMDFVKI